MTQPDRAKPVERICAWCGATLGERDGEGYGGAAVTHGICLECLNKELNRMGLPPLTPADLEDSPCP